jgi:hypothetical protein
MRHSVATEFESQVVEHASAVLRSALELGQLVDGPIHRGHRARARPMASSKHRAIA